MSRPAPEDELLTVLEVAHYLRVDRKTVYRYIHDAQLPYQRVGVGGNYRVRRGDLDAWLRRRTAEDPSHDMSHDTIM